MDIIIPSSGREAKQTTLKSLPLPLRSRVTIVVPEAEVPKYWFLSSHCKLQGIPVTGIGPTRQWVIENYGPKVLMLDDDLTFATRRSDETDKFLPATPEEIEGLMRDIDVQLTDYAHVGVAPREGANFTDESYTYNVRLLRMLAYRTDVLKSEGIKFTDIPVMEDFHVSLSLLRKGYASKCINYMAHNQTGSNTAGGCSQYRTDELQEAAARLLVEKHSPYVKLVKKKTKVAWQGKERYDVRIRWKSAYEADI